MKVILGQPAAAERVAGTSTTPRTPSVADVVAIVDEHAGGDSWDYQLIYQTTTAAYGTGPMGGALVFTGTAGSFNAGSVPDGYSGGPGYSYAYYTRTGTNPSIRCPASVGMFGQPGGKHRIGGTYLAGTGGVITIGWWDSAGDVIATTTIQGLGLVSSAGGTWHVMYRYTDGAIVDVADTGIARTGSNWSTGGTLAFEVNADDQTLYLLDEAGNPDPDHIYDISGFLTRPPQSYNSALYPLVTCNGCTSPTASLDFLWTRGKMGGGSW